MKKYKALVDKLYFLFLVPTLILIAAMSVIACLSPAPLPIIITVAVDLAVIYLLISPLFGYAQIRENSLLIKYGLIIKKEIPYSKIRGAAKERKFYSDSMLSLKNAFEHINIRYNTFDVTTVSVIDNDGFLEELNHKVKRS